MSKLWNEARLPPTEEGMLWELFHENSKTDLYDEFPSSEQVVETMRQLQESLALPGLPSVALPEVAELQMSLGQAIRSRISARGMTQVEIDLRALATVLDAGCGINRSNEGTEYVRAFRNAPSGGALYPLEVYFYAARVRDLEQGIYHYNPVARELRVLARGDFTEALGRGLVQSEWAADSAVVLLITAMFRRSTFKYRDRGYRFVLLEAGHVVQNMALASTAMGLNMVSIGGYFDRQIDRLLRLDGVTHSTVYLAALGG